MDVQRAQPPSKGKAPAEELIPLERVPWTKVQGSLSSVQDDEESFPTMAVWIVSFTDPAQIKILQEYLRGRPNVWERLQHLKLIRKIPSSDIQTIFQMIIGASNEAPSDLPQGFSAPEQCFVPSTPSFTRPQLKAKNELWPTVFSPHLSPVAITFAPTEIARIMEGKRLVIEEAHKAQSEGELPIAACLLPDQQLDAPLLARDTRTSTKHPLRHAAMNLVRALADKVLAEEQGLDGVYIDSITTHISPGQAGVPTLEGLVLVPGTFPTGSDLNHTSTSPQNGEGYQLTNKALFLTHEPCLMCTMALVHSRVKEIFIVHAMALTGGCGGQALVTELPTINHRFTVWRFKSQTSSQLETSIEIAATLDA